MLSMKVSAKLAVTCALTLVSGLQVATAAITCVEDKATGKFVERSGKSKPTGDCEMHTAMNMVSSTREVEDLAAGDGTKIIGGVLVTNAAKPFSTTPPKIERVYDEPIAVKPAPAGVAAEGPNSRLAAGSAPAPVGAGNGAPQALEAAIQEGQPFVQGTTRVSRVAPATTSAPVAAPVVASAAAKPAAASAAAPVAAPKSAQTWTITVGDKSVRSLLERWAKTSGHQLLWDLPVDLELNANATISGTFEDALNSVLASLAHSEYPIEAMIYDNGVVRMVKRISKDQQ